MKGIVLVVLVTLSVAFTATSQASEKVDISLVNAYNEIAVEEGYYYLFHAVHKPNDLSSFNLIVDMRFSSDIHEGILEGLDTSYIRNMYKDFGYNKFKLHYKNGVTKIIVL
jgi:hypothetical protein